MLSRIAVVICLLALTACGGSDDLPVSARSDSDNAKAEPRTKDAVRAVAEEQVRRYSSGDFKGTWDMWTKEGKDAFSRDDYARLGEECDLGGIPLEVSSIRLESDTEAVVRIGLGEITESYSILYEDGAWRWQPQSDSMDTYRLGYEGALEKLQTDGTC